MRTLLATLIAVLGSSGVVVAAAPVAAAEPPTGGELSAVVRECTDQVSTGLYPERVGWARTVPVCATANAVHWRSGMTIDCDGQATPKCNGSTDPSWQNATAWPQSDGRPLNAETLPFVVVPISSSIWDHFGSGITGGTVVAVVYQGRVVYGVVGDRGPSGQIGEGSYALAKALGINPDPRTGGVSGRVVDYIAFPGVKANPIENNADARTKGEQAATKLVDRWAGCAGVTLNYPSYPRLDAGATGPRVTAAQCLLRLAGQDTGAGAPTGVLDEQTATAVRAFQAAVRLPATGAVDAHTWTALLSAGTTPRLAQGASGAAVFRLQRALNAAVSAGLTIDGDFGALTATGVRNYQSANGLAVDGVVGANTWAALQAGK